jgi:hypothetical protein
VGRYDKYTNQTRAQWVRDNLQRIEAEGLSYRQISLEIQRQFGLDRPVSTATIGRDLLAARSAGIQPYSEEAMRLLEPENFPEARRLLFNYDTPKTQHALYWVLYALTLKVDLPDWVIEHFDLPEDINEDIVRKEKLLTFVLLVAPRMGKTMTMVHGLILLIAINPDVRVIYCQGIATTTEDINGLIMIEMEVNEKLKELYGPFEAEDRPWSRQKGFIVARRQRQAITPTFLPVGINSNVRSRDADIIVIDDPQDLDRAESEATTMKDYRKITTEFMTRREPHTPVLMVGSHLPTLHGDVFTQLEDNLDDLQTEGQTILLRKRPAHNLDKCRPNTGAHQECLEWPEMRDWNFLESQRALLGEELFEAVYQQEARIPGTRPFPPEIVKQSRSEGGILDPGRSWKESLGQCAECGGKLYTVLGFDPAAGEGKKASYSALAVLDGCIQCRTLYLIDYWQKRQSPELHAGTIASFVKSFNVSHVRVEINAYQKALARDNQLRESAREHKFMIDEWMTDDRKNSPEFGIPNLARWMRDGKFSVPAATHQDRMYYRELERAFIRYPIKPNDLPMAVWLAFGMMQEVWDIYAKNEPTYMPGREERVPAYMIENPHRIDMSLVSAE